MSTLVKRLIDGDRAAIALATEEYLAIHAHCDTAEIPRTYCGAVLSAAQRVEMLANKCVAYRGQVWKHIGALEG